MKVYQLIEELGKVDQKLEVALQGYEFGSDVLDREDIELKYIDWKGYEYNGCKQDYGGLHGEPQDLPDGMEDPKLVVLLKRKS